MALARVTVQDLTGIDQRACDDLLATPKGILAYVEDGNVVELRPCGFIEEVRSAIAKAERRE